MPLTTKLFRFAVVADTHVNERDDSSTSPFQAGPLANDRARHVFETIARLDPQPEFVIHLGDIVHPVPALPTFTDAVERFKDIVSCLTIPLHLLPGNHDVGDKRVDWMPADQVCGDYLALYRKSFGADYSAFEKSGVRFLLINSLLINSGLPEEAEQRAWLESQIASAEDKRVFAFMHYPPYIYRPDERSNYDNLDEPGRSWLLGLLSHPRVEAVFAGHVHNFWYDRIADAEFYMLPSTAFLRHDFTEFYRVAPSAEFGRSDVEKYGYFLVDVYAGGHVAYPVRTMGHQCRKGDSPDVVATTLLTHPKVSSFERVGVELRHPWAESQQITATGGVQEFGRKWARNDYPLLALWEMGVRLAKVPEMDVAEAESRERMKLLARMGHRFIVTSLGIPKQGWTREFLAECGIIGVEVNLTHSNFLAGQSRIAQFRELSGTRVLFSKILTYDGSHYDGKHFSHFVKSGFTVSELQEYETLIIEARRAGVIDGVTIRIEPDEPLPATSSAIRTFAGRCDCEVLASLKTSSASLALARTDDHANVVSAAHAMILSKVDDRIFYVFDTFMDVDRGYFPRNAFIDRRFNPRPAARAFAAINAVLSQAGPVQLDAGAATSAELRFRAGSQAYRLCAGTAADLRTRLGALDPDTSAHDLIQGRPGRLADLLEQAEERDGNQEPEPTLLLIEAS